LISAEEEKHLKMLTRQGMVFGRRLMMAQSRGIHHAAESAPPMRWSPVWQRFALFLGMCGAMLSYPTWVLVNLDNIRPRPVQKLSDEVMEKLEGYKDFSMGKH